MRGSDETCLGPLPEPTAQTSLADSTVSPTSWLFDEAPVPSGLGLLTLIHLLPFQRSVRVRTWFVPDALPTAQTLALVVAATDCKWLSKPGLGLATRFQARPFQCRISVLLFVSPATSLLPRR